MAFAGLKKQINKANQVCVFGIDCNPVGPVTLHPPPFYPDARHLLASCFNPLPTHPAGRSSTRRSRSRSRCPVSFRSVTMGMSSLIKKKSSPPAKKKDLKAPPFPIPAHIGSQDLISYCFAPSSFHFFHTASSFWLNNQPFRLRSSQLLSI